MFAELGTELPGWLCGKILSLSDQLGEELPSCLCRTKSLNCKANIVVITREMVPHKALLMRNSCETRIRKENGAEWYSLNVHIAISRIATSAKIMLIFFVEFDIAEKKASDLRPGLMPVNVSADAAKGLTKSINKSENHNGER